MFRLGADLKVYLHREPIDFRAGINTGLPAVDSAAGKKRGRRPMPEYLPRERVEYDLADDQKACPCCNGQMHRMGEAFTEQLHIEVKAKVLQNVRFKYACRHCDRTGINTPVVIAPILCHHTRFSASAVCLVASQPRR